LTYSVKYGISEQLKYFSLMSVKRTERQNHHDGCERCDGTACYNWI